MKKQKRKKQKSPAWLKRSGIWIFVVLFALLGYYILHLSKALTIYTPPGTIVSDCSVDIGISLSSWLQSLPNGATIQFKKNGCYLNQRYVRIDNKQNLTIDGNNATFRRTQLSPTTLRYPNANPHWWFKGDSNITVKNLVVQGMNKTSDNKRSGYGSYLRDYEFEAAFRVEKVNNSRFENIKVDAVYGDGLQLQDSKNSTIINSSIDRNGRQGIALVNTSNVLVNNVKILHSRRAGIDLENNTANQTISNVEIKNSNITSYLLALPAGGPGLVSNISFHDNKIPASGTPFVYNYRAGSTIRRSNWKIYNNVVQTPLNSPQPAILMADTDNITIAQNTVPLTATQSRLAIKFQDVGGSLFVRDNYFKNASSSYVTSGKVAAITACNNKLVEGGAFDRPSICPSNVENPVPVTPNSPNPNPKTRPGQTSGPTTTINNNGEPLVPGQSSTGDDHSSNLKTPIAKAANTIKKLPKSNWGRLIVILFVAAIVFLGIWLFRKLNRKPPWLK